MSGNKHFFAQIFRKSKKDLKKKNLGFVLIDFEVGCFSSLNLFHLSKIVTLLNIIAKVTPGAKNNSLRCKVCVWIV